MHNVPKRRMQNQLRCNRHKASGEALWQRQVTDEPCEALHLSCVGPSCTCRHVLQQHPEWQLLGHAQGSLGSLARVPRGAHPRGIPHATKAARDAWNLRVGAQAAPPEAGECGYSCALPPLTVAALNRAVPRDVRVRPWHCPQRQHKLPKQPKYFKRRVATAALNV